MLDRFLTVLPDVRLRTLSACAAVLLVALASSAPACEPEMVAAPSGGGGERGILLQGGSGEPSGAACTSDADCARPLRCMASACVVPPAVDGRRAADTPLLRINTGAAPPHEVWLEVADTPFEHQYGLMWRERMASDWGMLFIYPDEGIRSFWMKNTYLALDMVFIDARGQIVSIAYNAAPLDTGPSYRSEAPARYVLELNAGHAQRHGLAAGQQVTFVDVPGEHAAAGPR